MATESQSQISIRFDFDPEKFVSAATYLTSRCPDMTKMKLFKLLFYADKHHLAEFGRPVIGDKYVKMEWGPVPSASYDIIKRRRDRDLLDRHLSVRGSRLIVQHEPDLDSLSDSDVQALDVVLREYGRKTAEELSDLSHLEQAWIQASDNGPMDYKLFFGESPDEARMLEIVIEDQDLRNLAADVCVR